MQTLEAFLYKPAPALSIMLCMASIIWAATLVSRLRRAPDRYLVGLIGVLSLQQAFQSLQDLGIAFNHSVEHWQDFAMLVVSALYLVSVAVLQLHTAEYRNTEYRLRLAEANETHVSPPSQREAVLSHPDEEKVIRAFLHSSPLAIFVVDSSGQVIYWSDAAERLFGWGRADVTGHPPPFRIPATSGGGSSICRVMRRDGASLDVELHTAPLRDGSFAAADWLVVASVPVAATSGGVAPGAA